MNLHAHMASATPAPLTVYGTALSSRMFIGTAGYPSPDVLAPAVKVSGAEVVTVSLRRESAGGRVGEAFMELINALGVKLLPNTAGCRTARDAIATAEMARELFGTDWIKLEVIANDDTLQPDVFGLVEAAKALNASGFKVFPYTTEDLSVAERLLAAGCQVIMPWGAPIGTGRGIANKPAMRTLRAYFPGVPLVMAEAFATSVKAGRLGYEAGLMAPRDMAVPSTPVAGTPFFDFN